jgi:hypothetical protein
MIYGHCHTETVSDDFSASVKWTADGPKTSISKTHSARDAGGKWSKLIEKNKLEKIDASINEKVADLEKKLKKEKEKFDAARSGVPQAVKALNLARKNFQQLPKYLIENLASELESRISECENLPISFDTEFVCPDGELLFKCGLLKYPDPYTGKFPLLMLDSLEPNSAQLSSDLAIKMLQISWVEESLLRSLKKYELNTFLTLNDLSVDVKTNNPVQVVVSEVTDVTKNRITVS